MDYNRRPPSPYNNRYPSKFKRDYGTPNFRREEPYEQPKQVRRYEVNAGERIFVRNSPNVFTHAVVGRKEGKPIEVLKWCMNIQQAETEMNLRGNAGYIELRILEAQVLPYRKEITDSRGEPPKRI